MAEVLTELRNMQQLEDILEQNQVLCRLQCRMVACIYRPFICASCSIPGSTCSCACT